MSMDLITTEKDKLHEIIKIFQEYSKDGLKTLLNLNYFKFILENDLIDLNNENNIKKVLYFLNILSKKRGSCYIIPISEHYYDIKIEGIEKKDEILKLLIRKGINLNSSIDSTYSILSYIYDIATSQFDITKCLIENKYDFKSNKTNLLIRSLNKDLDTESIDLIMENNYKLSDLYNSEEFNRCIENIVFFTKLQLFKIFIKYGDMSKENTNFMFSVVIKHNNYEFMKILLENEIKITDKDILDEIEKKDYLKNIIKECETKIMKGKNFLNEINKYKELISKEQKRKNASIYIRN